MQGSKKSLEVRHGLRVKASCAVILGHGVSQVTLVTSISEDQASRLIHLQEAFAKTNKATNILRPAIDVSFWADNEEFLAGASNLLKKKKIEKNFFHHTKSSTLEILSKSSRTQIRLLGTPRNFLRSRTTILGG